MRSLNTQLIYEQTQKLYPFGKNEERFRWQNSTLQNHISTGDDIDKFKIKRFEKHDNLDGGIGTFYIKNEKYKYQTIKANRHRFDSFDKKNISLILNSHRVIHPSLNNEVERRKINQKRICVSSEKLRYSTDERITSLFQKTPLTIEIKGKKRFNRSFDNNILNQANDSNAFQDKIKTGIRLFLKRTPFLTIDTTSRTPGRKHFLNKMKTKMTIS